MSMIKDIKTYLVANGVSTPIYLGHVPEGESECIGLYRYSGKSRLKDAGIERCGLQVRCRAANYEDSYDMARFVNTLLSNIGDEDNDGDAVVIDEAKYFRVYANQSHLVNENDEYVETVDSFVVCKG